MISACCFATLVIFCKIGYNIGLNTSNMMTIRFEFGAASLLIYFIIADRKALIPTKRLIIKTFLVGIGLYIGQSYLFIKSVQYIPASTVSLILYAYPMTVLIFSVVFLKEKFRSSSFVSVILILLGCCLVFYDAFARQINSHGIMLAVASMVLFSVYLIVSQVVMRGENPMAAVFYIVLFTMLGYIVMNGGTGFSGLTKAQLILGICLGVIPSAIAIGFQYKAISRIGAAYVSIFSSIEPVVTLILAAAMLGEKIAVYQIFGVILLIGGIVIPNLKFIRA